MKVRPGLLGNEVVLQRAEMRMVRWMIGCVALRSYLATQDKHLVVFSVVQNLVGIDAVVLINAGFIISHVRLEKIYLCL